MGSMEPAHLTWTAGAFKLKKSGIESHPHPLLTRQVPYTIQASVFPSLKMGHYLRDCFESQR